MSSEWVIGLTCDAWYVGILLPLGGLFLGALRVDHISERAGSILISA